MCKKLSLGELFKRKDWLVYRAFAFFCCLCVVYGEQSTTTQAKYQYDSFVFKYCLSDAAFEICVEKYSINLNILL